MNVSQENKKQKTKDLSYCIYLEKGSFYRREE